MKKLFHKTIFALASLLILYFTDAQAQNYYRSVASGNWATLATWQASPDNITWGVALTVPNYTDYTITVQSPNVVTITGTATFTVDQVVINSGATVINSMTTATGILSFNDGTGDDLIVNGTFQESQAASITWTATATWLMGPNGTLIRACSNSVSSNFWQQHYSGGLATSISTIPSTSNWILRKTSTQTPAISTTVGGVGAWYPNLIIENSVAGLWTTAGSSIFTGTTAFPTIKGNFDIGGTGIGTVDFLNDQKNAAPTRVIGNLIIRTGNILRNFGTGLEVQGNVTISGTLSYDTGDLRTFDFAGGSAQTVSGAGAMNIFQMRMRKSGGDVTLARAIKVDNTITFTSVAPGGRLFSTSTNLITIEDNATATGASNTSHVDGPVRKLGDEAFTYPVGKNGYYRLCAMGIATGGGGGAFWTENFNSGCTSLCQASSYSGPNGAWTITNLGPSTACGYPVASNTWYVSCAESGTGAGSCGTSCGSTASLHLGNVSTSPAAPFFCPSGDCGAAYDAGGLCGLPPYLSVITDKRAESPTINCTGQTGISVSFNYMEFGQGTQDNATLWYFDGSVWSQIDDMPKITCCGGACNGVRQGQFTARVVALPASSNNNPNVKIAFRWVNDDDGAGTDPSFAVDDVSLGTFVGVDSYTAEYFRANPQVVYNNIMNPPLDHISQCEYWTLNRNVGLQNRTVTLSWDTPNSCGVTNLSDLRVAYFNSASWDDKGNGGTTGSIAAGTIVTSSTVNSFGPFTLSSMTTENPLPVSLLDFSARAQGNNVMLDWTTTTEINNDRFEILSSESSSGPTVFEEIGQVKGIGNSTSVHKYSYLDERPSKKGTYYYRLHQVDFDGKSTHSNIVAVNFKEGNELTLVGVIPNPYTDRTSVQMFVSEKGMLQQRILDIFGREISSATYPLDKGMFSFDPEESVRLIPGIYFVELLFNDEKVVTRLVKE